LKVTCVDMPRAVVQKQYMGILKSLKNKLKFNLKRLKYQVQSYWGSYCKSDEGQIHPV